MKTLLLCALLSTVALQLVTAQLSSHELPDDLPRQVPFPNGLPNGSPDEFPGGIPQPLPLPLPHDLPNDHLPNGGFPGGNPKEEQKSNELPNAQLNDLPNLIPAGSQESHELPGSRIPNGSDRFGFHPRRQLWSCHSDTTADLACATWPSSATCGCGTECADNHCKCKLCTGHDN
ncbi:hypothetical protein M3Y99_01779700 [Aphelenchoides fujianensis]|nr:hypothetical protein M3Y99_01779700 [Aphelenchoides fujianensis]